MSFPTEENLNRRLKKPLTLRKSATKVKTYGSVTPTLKIKGVTNVLVQTKVNKKPLRLENHTSLF